MSEITFPLALSAAGHAVGLALLVWLLPASLLPVPVPLATPGIEVAFEPNLPKPEHPQIPAAMPTPSEATPPEPEPPPPTEPEPVPPSVAELEPPPPPPEPEPPPPPPEPVVATEAPAAVVEPPPPPKPAVKPQPKQAQRRQEKAQPTLAAAPAQPPPAAIAPPQTAYVPAPAPAEVSPGYRALLSAWLESHKRYPDASRQRGEEGRAVLRFTIDRSGRVLDYTVAQSTGYPALDTSIEEMMRGAVLPPFPPAMTQPRIDVSVTIRFSLAR